MNPVLHRNVRYFYMQISKALAFGAHITAPMYIFVLNWNIFIKTKLRKPFLAAFSLGRWLDNFVLSFSFMLPVWAVAWNLDIISPDRHISQNVSDRCAQAKNAFKGCPLHFHAYVQKQPNCTAATAKYIFHLMVLLITQSLY